MNINKMILIFVVLMTFALSLTCVSAVDFNNESVTDLSGFNDDNAVGEFSTQTNGIYSDVSDGTFTDLQSEINNAPEGSVLKLNRNYCGSEGAVVNLNKDLTIDGQGHTIDCLEDDCQAFYSSSGTITLKNLKITNSYGSELSSLHYGAIYITGSAKYTIENCVFEHNIVHDEHGGAICHHGEQLNITNCQFINNRGEHGGAIFIAGSSRYTIENCVFKDNYAFVFGGAIYSERNQPHSITNCEFINNGASSEGGAIYSEGDLYIDNSTFKDNNAGVGGAICSKGNIYVNYYQNDSQPFNTFFINNMADDEVPQIKSLDGGALYAKCNIFVKNSVFMQNSALDDGGAFCSIDNAEVIHCLFDSNQAKGATVSECEGGAIYCKNKLTIKNSEFTNNHADVYGGAIYVDLSSSEIIVDQCSFIGNSAGEDGGAICCMNNAVVTNCLFDSNQAKGSSAQCEGGAIYCDDELTLDKSEFKNNCAEDYGGAVYAGTVKDTISDSIFINNKAENDDGGAIYINNKCDPKFYNCSFEKNSCGDEGGAIYADSASSEVNLEQCSFIENSAGEDGGAICCMNNAVVTNCLFDSNQAKGSSEQCEGGAIFCDDELTLKNSVFKNNCAEDYGGAVYTGTVKDSISDSVFINNKAEKDDGGAIFIDDECNPGFYACLFEKNSCGDEGGAIYIDDSDSQVSIEHCSFSDNSASEDNGQSVYNCGDYTTVNRCWHGTNSPDFTDQFKIWHSVASDEDYIPSEYAVICMKLNDTTFYMGTPYDVSVYFCLNTNPGEVLSDIPFNELIYSGDGEFSNPDNHHELTKKVTFTKEDATINAALDHQTLSLNVKVVPSVIIADNIKRGVNSPYDYYVTLVYADGKPIMGRQITFTIDGKEYKAISDAEGIARVSAGLTLVNDTDTVYSVVVTNPDTLENVTATTTIVPRLIVVPGDLTADYLSNPPYVVQAIGDDGNPVGENETVNVVFAGFGYDLKTDAAGHVVRTIGLAPGMYAVKACYKGYNTTSTLFMVSQVLKVTSGTIKKTAKSYTLKATLKSSNGKALANKEVILSFKGKTYKVFTNSKGVASKKITASVIKTLKAGKTYTLQARYVNDIAKGKIKVVK